MGFFDKTQDDLSYGPSSMVVPNLTVGMTRLSRTRWRPDRVFKRCPWEGVHDRLDRGEWLINGSLSFGLAQQPVFILVGTHC